MLADFFGPPRDESEGLTVALVALILGLVLEELLLVVFEVAAAEASRISSNTEAVFLR